LTEHKNTKPNLIMMYVSLSTFTQRDINILNSNFNVTSYHFNTSNKLLLPLAFFKQFIYLALHSFKIDVIVTQSSGYLSFLPVIYSRLFRKKMIIIAIGTDCAKLPEIKYGAHSKIILAWFTRFSFRYASLILPVHKSLEETTYTYDKVKFPKQGIRSFVKNIKTPIVEVVNGYDIKKWVITEDKRIENSFLTVSFAIDKIGYYRKGIDMVIKAAKLFPRHQFTVVGKVVLDEECPSNVKLISNVSQKELVKIYNKHQYYLQLSMFEGFPNALCEAMLCGCIPIGSKVAGIPDIIGDKGYVLNEKSTKNLVEVITRLENNSLTPLEVRNQIGNNFPLLKRKKLLTNSINKALNY